MFILKRYYKFYKYNGLINLIIKIISTPYRKINKKFYKRKKENIFNQKDFKSRFELIYESNFWNSKESVSGLGSEYKNTLNIRVELVKLINQFKIRKILDTPCGDFNWIQSIITDDITYTGGDIVKKLIDQNNQIYKKKNITFFQVDITKDKLPDNDLMICRDCLIHLSFKNIDLFFRNFINSNIKYILLTTYKLKEKKEFINEDIPDGEFREIDLSKPPFLLSKPIYEILDKDEQTKNSGFYCYLNLYSRDQIIDVINKKN